MGEKDPLLARLLAAATAGASPAGPAHKRAPVRIVLDPDATPVAKGKLCGQHRSFNLQAATKVAVPQGLRDGLPALPTPRASRSPVANDKKGRENLCKYILRPPLANDRLKILDDGNVRLEFKRPWSDGDGRGEAAWGRGWVGRP
jgi:Putative transposase.